MNKKKNIGNNLQKYRVWKGLLQADFANQTGISISEVRLIEQNKVSPNPRTTTTILKYFDVSYDQMFYAK